MLLESYKNLPHPERTVLRRLAFGATNEQAVRNIQIKDLSFSLDKIPYSLLEIKKVLVEENERTGWFPTRWVDGPDFENSSRNYDALSEIRLRTTLFNKGKHLFNTLTG